MFKYNPGIGFSTLPIVEDANALFYSLELNFKTHLVPIYTKKMSRSGVAVNDEVVKAFNELKLRKSLKFIVFSFNDAKTEIVVEKTSSDSDYDTFLEALPENDCRYAIYDFEYEIGNGEGKRSKILLYSWSPDNSPVKSKFLYSSSSEALTRALTGVASHVQASDFSDVAYDEILNQVRKGSH